MSKDKELKPCPFCGSESEEGVDGTGPFVFYVACVECGACVQDHGTRREARAAWNARQPDKELVEALEWIALQPCKKEAEGSDDTMDCSQTGSCITEYCLPCYAQEALSRHKEKK